MINLYTTYEVSMLTHYEDMKGDEKCKNWDITSKVVNDDTWNAIFSKLTLYRNPFCGLESEYMQLSYLEKRGMLVRSDAYVIGNKPTFVYDKQTSRKNQVNESVTGEY